MSTIDIIYNNLLYGNILLALLIVLFATLFSNNKFLYYNTNKVLILIVIVISLGLSVISIMNVNYFVGFIYLIVTILWMKNYNTLIDSYNRKEKLRKELLKKLKNIINEENNNNTNT